MVDTKMISYDVAKNTKDVIRYFYDTEDWYFFRHIHKAQGTKEECIADTISTIDDESIMYLVYWNGELAAYFVKYTREDGMMAMEGFHVLKQFRNKEFLKHFWNVVRACFRQEFYVAIFCKNQPALKCLALAGFSVLHLILVKNQIFVIFKS